MIRDRAIAVLLCGVAFFVVGCKTLNQIAPPVDERLTRTAGSDPATLERGRHIYLNQCIKCHVAEPVLDYDARQWPAILLEMNKASKLTPDQAADLKAYIDACLAAGPDTPS